MKRSALSLLGAAVVFALVSGCGGSGGESDDMSTHTVEANYPVYRSVAALAAASDLVVSGTVVGKGSSRRIMPEGVDLSSLPKRKAEAVGVVVTDFTIKTDRVHKGGPGERIVVRELGGRIGDQTWVSEDEPLSSPGDKVLLFLKRQDGDVYAAVGGPQGRYLIRNGKARKRFTGDSVPAVMDGRDASSPPLGDTVEVAPPAHSSAPVAVIPSTEAKPTR